MALRLVAVSLLVLQAHAVNLQAAPAPAAAGAPSAPGAPEIQYSKDFEKDWHKEWKHGDFPSWKKVIKVDGVEKFEDRQSDGKPGFLQASAPAPAAAGAPGAPGAPAAPEIQYSKDFEKDWHKEWKHGDFPSWKKVIKVDGVEKFEDRQSDGKPGALAQMAKPIGEGAYQSHEAVKERTKDKNMHCEEQKWEDCYKHDYIDKRGSPPKAVLPQRSGAPTAAPFLALLLAAAAVMRC
jgi:mRNA-degrading endonuclease YafQ of YafQ-DinJ toxin-antitoxin module